MVWTNAVGVAFTATLLSVGNDGAKFVFPEDGATNTLSLAKLSTASARRACEVGGFVPVPPALASTVAQTRRELCRLAALEADGRIGAEAAQIRHARICAAFLRSCREKGMAEDDARALLKSLEAASRQIL